MSLRRTDFHIPAAALRSAAAAILFSLALPFAAAAQLPFKVYVAGGYGVDISPDAFTEQWSGGVSLAGGLQYRLSSRANAWLEVGYHRFAFETGVFEGAIADDFPGVSVSGNDLWVLPVHVGMDFSLTSWGNTRPYVLGGIGYDHVDHRTAAASGPNAEHVVFPNLDGDVFAVRLGGGVRTLISPSMTLFFDAAWHQAWTSPDPIVFVPIRVGLRF